MLDTYTTPLLLLTLLTLPLVAMGSRTGNHVSRERKSFK